MTKRSYISRLPIFPTTNIRSHEALDGKTPADACGIDIQGKNKWLNLIQNAAQKVDFLNPKIEHYLKKQGTKLIEL